MIRAIQSGPTPAQGPFGYVSMPQKESRQARNLSLEELGHGSAEVDEVDRFRDVVAKSRRDTLVLNIRHDIG